MNPYTPILYDCSKEPYSKIFKEFFFLLFILWLIVVVFCGLFLLVAYLA
jgi:hypothetical protein